MPPFLRLLPACLLPALTADGAPFTSPRLEAVTSWVGNTYGGGTKWVQQDIHALTVTADGTVFTNVPWDEAGGNAGEYRDGQLVRHALHTHGWGYEGGEAVACNSRYVFIAGEVANEGGGLKSPDSWPAKGSRWIGVSRRLRQDLSQPAPFDGGKGGQGDTLKSAFLVTGEMPDTSKQQLPGLCADEQRLYVADPLANRLRVYSTESMQELSAWPVERTGPLAIDPHGLIWLLQRKTAGSPARLLRYDADGKPQGQPLTLDPAIIPASFCLTSDGRVLIADDSPAQQVRIFSVSAEALKEEGRFGEPGGISSGTPGAFGERKFNHLSALGCDAKDNLYVAHDGQSGGGGTVLESYRLGDGHLNWRLLGLTFVDMADFDPGSDSDLYTKEEHFHFDASQPPGKEASYQGYTLAAEKYPQDPRLHIWSGGAWLRRIAGQRFLFVNDMNGDNLQVYRFRPSSDGETAIPCSLFAKKPIRSKDAWPPAQPQQGAWLWRDANGDGRFDPDEYQATDAEVPAAQGWSVDELGNVWLATETQGIRYYACRGLDAHGSPQWDLKSVRTFPHPAGFREVKRLRYDVPSDTLYLGGTTDADRNQHWKPMGPVLACYDHGSRGGTLRWQITLPYAAGSSGHESCEPMGFDPAGDFLFVPYTGASKSDQVSTGRVEIFRSRDGSAVGHVEPDPEVGEVGLQDVRETLTAHRRRDGEYDVMIEDDLKSKVVLYRLRNLK